MVAKKNVILLTAVLATLLGAGALLWRGARAPAPAPGPVGRGPVVSRPVRLAPAPIQVPTGEVSRDPTGPGSVEGRVISTLDGSGVPAAELTFVHADALIAAHAGPDGRFTFTPARPGSYLLTRVAAPGYVAFSAGRGDSPVAFALRPRERIRGVLLALSPTRTCRGRVVDRSGAPTPRARLRVWMPPHLATAAPEDRETDEQGTFEFLAIDGVVLEARHAQAVARVEVGPRRSADCTVTLRLGPPREVTRSRSRDGWRGQQVSPWAGS